MKLVDALRRRLSGAIDPEFVDRVLTQLTDSSRRDGKNALMTSILGQDDALFEAWQSQLRDDIRTAFASVDRNEQIVRVRELCKRYLARSNDGWRALEDPRITKSELETTFKIRDAFASAQAMKDAADNFRRNQQITPAPDDATAYFNLRRKQLLYDGALGELALGFLEAITKTLLKVDAVADSAHWTMDLSDIKYLIQYKAMVRLKHEKDGIAGPNRTRGTEALLAESLQRVVDAVCVTALPRPESETIPGRFGLLESEWAQGTWRIGKAGPLTDVIDCVATAFWSGLEPIIRDGNPRWLGPHSGPDIPSVVMLDMSSIFFYARMIGVPAHPSKDIPALLHILSGFSASRKSVELLDEEKGTPVGSRIQDEQRTLLQLEIWLVHLDADMKVHAEEMVTLATRAAGIADLEYLEQLERIAIYALTKYAILMRLVNSRDGSVGSGYLSSDWPVSYKAFLKRENQLMLTLLTILRARLAD